MSRFNVSVLLATALLGVLLWVVISIVAEVSNPTPLVTGSETTAPAPDPALPRILDMPALESWVAEGGASATRALNQYRDWLAERGYPPARDLLTGAAVADAVWAEQDDATLLVIAGRGDLAALHTLAERSIASDPRAALDWYDQAVINGSLYAMLRISDLLATLGDPALAAFNQDTQWQQALAELNAADPPPLERSLAWAIGAVYVGGFGIVDPRLASRIRSLSGQLDEFAVERACEAAQDLVLETAAARRARGGAVFSMQRPRFAVSVADPAGLVPCSVRVPPLVDMGDCEHTDFVGPGQQLLQAWYCP
ncbi:MAG: hypothetical protein V2J12_02280 [Gammaproteobacteria bacterium]|nr:hypothetical protein [Gammaproteobacteria bacterium]